MSTDYRCFIKFESPEIWRDIMNTLEFEAFDGEVFSLLEISKVFNTSKGMMQINDPIGLIFDTVTAVEKEAFLFIHDKNQSAKYFKSLSEYIFSEVVSKAENKALFIADLTDYSDDMVGDRIFYYCGGENAELCECAVEGPDGLDHHRIELSNVKEMLKYEPLSDEQKEYIDKLNGENPPKRLMNSMRLFC